MNGIRLTAAISATAQQKRGSAETCSLVQITAGGYGEGDDDGGDDDKGYDWRIQ
ncbi:hypothetical protein PLICRDRAFT_180932 [Plicaturopsis crispa FD-325 SS-3]|uniref:Uncharacterized protein n=1 Tax=Plicaturopsis crispa FD-325 SS-3 TaxID=944288 RepID=A0A0C9T139_PLICR|nr:hypothetical protein PLICRDRAFT_180932 [Plicaturopsis crispa FD-325 SS-3]